MTAKILKIINPKYNDSGPDQPDYQTARSGGQTIICLHRP